MDKNSNILSPGKTVTSKKRKPKSASDVATNVVAWVFLGLQVVLALFPIYFMLVLSVTPNKDLLGTPSMFPKSFSFEPYISFFKGEYLFGYELENGGWRNGYLLNTLIVCASCIGGTIVAGSLSAYGITKVRIKGKGIIFGIIMATIFLPSTVTSIPLYIIYNELGWNGTLLPLTIPIWFGGGAMTIFLIRQFMRGIPDSLTEAAMIDGASSFDIYLKIILPNIAPILLYLAVTTFIGTWNDYSGPLLYLGESDEYWTLSLAIYKDFANPNGMLLANSQMAYGVIMMIPCLILFAFFKKQLVEGISVIGIKG